jgi:hypothetical protein
MDVEQYREWEKSHSANLADTFFEKLAAPLTGDRQKLIVRDRNAWDNTAA